MLESATQMADVFVLEEFCYFILDVPPEVLFANSNKTLTE